MTGLESSATGLRGRTRRAILDAAMSVLADNPSASLSDIAAAAEVGRSTVHRYFAERTELIKALAVHVHALSNAAIEAAEPDMWAADRRPATRSRVSARPRARSFSTSTTSRPSPRTPP